MTIAYTRNLRLRIDSNMTTSAKFNLETLDGVFSSFVTTMGGTKVFSSTNGFLFMPAGNSPGGSMVYGGQTTPLASFRVYGPLTASSLSMQPTTGDYSFTFLPNIDQTQNISLTMPATYGSAGQALVVDPTDPTRLVFGDIVVEQMTDAQIVAAQLGSLLLINSDLMAGDSIETALGKVQGQFNNLTPLRAMSPISLVKTNAEGFLTELTEVTPAALVRLNSTAGSTHQAFLTATFQAITPGRWTILIPPATHGLGADVFVSCVFDSTGEQVMVDSTAVSGLGVVSLSVLSTPDLRFNGSVVISKTGA